MSRNPLRKSNKQAPANGENGQTSGNKTRDSIEITYYVYIKNKTSSFYLKIALSIRHCSSMKGVPFLFKTCCHICHIDRERTIEIWPLS
jgi:hypothetical protein